MDDQLACFGPKRPVSTRGADVPVVDPEIFLKPERLHQYIRSEEAREPVREKAIRLVKSVLK